MFSCLFSRKPSKGALGTGGPSSHIGRQDRDLIVADCWRKTGKMMKNERPKPVSGLRAWWCLASSKHQKPLQVYSAVVVPNNNNYYWLQKEPLLWKTTKNWHFWISSIWPRWANRINDQLHDFWWCVAKYDNTRIQHNTVKINKVSPFCFFSAKSQAVICREQWNAFSPAPSAPQASRNRHIPTTKFQHVPTACFHLQNNGFNSRYFGTNSAIQSQGGEATHPPVLDRHCLETMPSSPNNTCGTLDSEQ